MTDDTTDPDTPADYTGPNDARAYEKKIEAGEDAEQARVEQKLGELADNPDLADSAAETTADRTPEPPARPAGTSTTSQQCRHPTSDRRT